MGMSGFITSEWVLLYVGDVHNLDNIVTCTGKSAKQERTVAFSAYLASRYDGGPLRRNIIYGRLVTGIGGGYNTTTGYFTAPVDGVYAFVWSCLTAPGSIFDTELVLNGVRKSLNNCNNRDGIGQLTCTGMSIVDMNAGDSVNIRSIYGEFLYEDWSWFHGWKI